MLWRLFGNSLNRLARSPGVIGEEAVGELAFLGLEGVDALLDGALADELVEEDRLAETQTLAAILNLPIFLIKLCIIS